MGDLGGLPQESGQSYTKQSSFDLTQAMPALDSFFSIAVLVVMGTFLPELD